MKNKILSIIFLIIIIFTAYKIITTLNTYKVSKETYEKLNEYINTETSILDDTTEVITTKEVDFTSLKKINQDIIAWIYIEGTNINYPIVQGKDNDYYLNHLITKKTNSSGSIFMDYRNENNFNNKHTIIYGHNMKNGTMFAELAKYKNQEQYNTTSSYKIITPEKSYKVDIISGYVASVKENSWQLEFENDQELNNWLKQTKEKSFFESNITPSLDDKIITLSTCSYEFNNAKFVLVGIQKDNQK